MIIIKCKEFSVFTDASFDCFCSIAGIAMIIKNNENRCIARLHKKIVCKNSTEAELRALNTILSFIINKQSKKLFAQNCKLTFFCDSQSVVTSINRKKFIKNVDRSIMGGCFGMLMVLRKTNEVSVTYLCRRYNKEADNISREVLSLARQQLMNGDDAGVFNDAQCSIE